MVWHSHLFQNFPQFIVIHTVKGFGTRLFQTLGFEIMGFPGGSDGKESAYNVGDPGSIPESGRLPGKRNATHSSILALGILWTEEPGKLQSMGSQRAGHD